MCGRVAALCWLLPAMLMCAGLAAWGSSQNVLASPLAAGTLARLVAQPSDLVVEVAKKRRRKGQARREAKEAEPQDFQPGPDDRLVVADGVQILIKPLTPAETYRAGQSIFLLMTVGRRKGARARAATIRLYGDTKFVRAAEAKGLSAKTKAAQTVLTVPLGGSRQSFAIELQLGQQAMAPGTQQSLVSQLHIALSTDAKDARISESIVAFPLADCSTAYHQALGRLYAERQSGLDTAVKAAAVEDESLPGNWLFAPRKLSKAELEPPLAVVAPPRRECRWAIETVSFSTKKHERLCKKWELVEVATPPRGPKIPIVDEARAQAINERAGVFIESRTAARAFGKSGKLEWISKRIVTDMKSYMQQEPHPALCAGTDVMTSYFVDNAVTLRKELTTSDEALIEARQIAQTRLAALEFLIGKSPEDPAETASISLVSAAQAASVADVGGSAELIGELSRMLLFEPLSSVVAAEPLRFAKLRQLRDGVATLTARPEAEQRAIADALTAVEAAVYLEAAAERYARVGDAIFGSISSISKAHGETCTCAP